MISVARRHIHSDFYDWGLLSTLYELNIQDTLPELQHDFCMLWNGIASTKKRPRITTPDSFPVGILRLRIHHLYIALHQDADAASTTFSASTYEHTYILFEPSSYPFCKIARHRPLPTPPGNSPDALSPSPTDGGNAASQQAEQVNNAIEPHSSSNSTTTSEIGATSCASDMTLPTSSVSFPALVQLGCITDSCCGRCAARCHLDRHVVL